MLNHFFFRDFNGYKLITNDFGRYSFLNDKEFNQLLADKIQTDSKKYTELKEKYFIYEGNRELFLEEVKDISRYSRKYLFSATALFIFVVTNRCNADCVYCQAKNSASYNNEFMTFETAEKGVDIALSSPVNNINIEFQGGEPLMNFSVIKHIVEFANKRAIEVNKRIAYSLVSNLTLLTCEINEFIKENNIGLSTSLDGDEETHNYNRPLQGNKPSYETVIRRISENRKEGIHVGAIETTTSKTLNKYRELVDTYIKNNINTVFIRPLTPLGAAKQRWSEIGYTAEEYTEFYRNCINYILVRNKEGHSISEGHARIFLSKILYGEGVNYMELRSPCGASIGQMAIYHDGRIFTCDEGRMIAEMGNCAFQLGTVEDSYNELINCSVCKATCVASVLETIPSCCDCVFSPFCGICPVINLAFDNDIFARTPKNYRCKVYDGMLSVLFEILQKNEETDLLIFKSWARGE